MKPAAFEALGGFVVRFRVLIVAVWAAVTVIAMLALPSLGREVNSDPSLFLRAGAPSMRAESLAAPLLGSTATSRITIVAARAGGPLTRADLASVNREADLARGVGGVLRVRPGALSPDGKAAQVEVRVAMGAKDVAGLRPVVRALQQTFTGAQAPSGLEFHLAGPVASNVAANASGNKASGRIGLLSILFILVLLLIVLRSPVAAVVTFLPSVVALLVSQRLAGALGAGGLQISSVTQTLLIVLLLGAGTDYGLFLVYRYREEVRSGTGPHAAVTRALTRVGMSVTASAGTVILALLTLLLASFGLYRDLAVPLAAGIAVMLLAGLTLLPALLALAAGFAFPGVRSRGHEGAAAAPGGALDGGSVAGTGTPGGPDGLWGRAAARAVRRPGPVLVAGVAIFGALAAGVLGYRTAGLNRSTTAPAGSDAAAGDAILAAHFPQSATSPADLILRFRAPVWRHPGSLVGAGQTLAASHLFATLAGPLSPAGAPLSPAAYRAAHSGLGDPRRLPLAEPAGLRVPRRVYDTYRATAAYVSPDGRTVRFTATLRAGDQESTAAMDATPAVRTALAAAARRAGASADGLTGKAAALYDVSTTADSDMVLIIPVAVLAIAVLLGLVLRSLVAPLYLVASIVLSYLAALGCTSLLVIDAGGQDGLIFVLPFLMFVFLLALGEDYNILVMTRIREECQRFAVREAVVAAIGRTGPAITSAGLILAGTFAVFAIAGGGVMGGQLRPVGLALALGILADTFVVRTLLVPATAALLGRWNWWPSRLSRVAAPPGGVPPGGPVPPGVPARPGEVADGSR